MTNINPVEIKIVITLKENSTPEQADIMAKKMIKCLTLNELCLIEEARVQQIMAEINIDAPRGDQND